MMCLWCGGATYKNVTIFKVHALRFERAWLIDAFEHTLSTYVPLFGGYNKFIKIDIK